MPLEDILLIGKHIAELGLGNAAIGGFGELLRNYTKDTETGKIRISRKIIREMKRLFPYTEHMTIPEDKIEKIIFELKDWAIARKLEDDEFFEKNENEDNANYDFFKKTVTTKFPPPPPPVPVPTMPVPPAMPAELPMGPAATPPALATPFPVMPMPTMSQSTNITPRDWRPEPGVVEEFKNGGNFSKLRTRVIEGVGKFMKKYYKDKVFTRHEIFFRRPDEMEELLGNYPNWADIDKVIEDAYPEAINLSRETYGRQDRREARELFHGYDLLPALLPKGFLKRYQKNQFPFYSNTDLNPRFSSQRTGIDYAPVYYVNSPEGKVAMTRLLEEQAKLEDTFYARYLAAGGKKQRLKKLEYPPIA